MAFFDNKLWLLSHIRNSFICTDDTGMCETVMAGEDIPKQLLRVSSHDTYPGFDESSDEDDMDLPESYEIQTNYFDNTNYRQRSNTAQYIEKMNIARKKAAKIKNVKWEDNQANLTSKEKLELFTKKECLRSANNSYGEIKRTSMLTELITKTANLPKNPFIEYSNYDGSARVDVPIRKYKIFITMLPESERNYPIIVCVVSSARVLDLIGLSLLKFSMTHPEYQFKSISHYDLYITEDDGEMDKDFPPLDTRECINKFRFNCLSLVEHKHKKSISFESTEIHQRNKELGEKTEEKVANQNKYKPSSQEPDDYTKLRNYTGAVLAPIYKCFKVYIINKVRAKTEVNLGVSGEKIEIDPVQQKNNKFWVRQKPVTYQMDNIAWCEILDDSKNSRTTFRLVYTLMPCIGIDNTFLASANTSVLKTSPSFKHHDFEADKTTAHEIVQKINYNLELRSSTSRKDYLTIKERKSNRRRSFHLVSRT